MKPDYYKILGLQPGATASEIKRSYRKLALRYHPDHNPHDADAEEKFKWVAEAYQVLQDPQQRAVFDRDFFDRNRDVLREVKNQKERLFYAPANDVLGDFFRGFFGQPAGTAKPRGRQGEDLRYNLKVSFVDAALGADIEIKVPYQKECPVCHGSGAKSGSSEHVCPQCRGKGRVKTRQGSLEVYRTCHKCGGKGAVTSSPCGKCSGCGTVESRRSLTVPVPAGVETGTRLRLRGQGAAGCFGGQAGDLVVVIQSEPHPLLKRDGLNVRCEVPIPVFTALLGGSITIPTLEGPEAIKISHGIESGTEITLSGRGMASSQQKKRGDLIVHLRIELPEKLSRRDKTLLTAFVRQHNPALYPAYVHFMKQMKTC
jgi:molecular chaperone DnaJ